MRSALFLAALLFSLPRAAEAQTSSREPIQSVIVRGLDVSTKQALLLANELQDKPGRLPRSWQQEKLETGDYRGWTSGFFPGVLWYLYQNSPSEELKRFAELYTARVEPAKNLKNSHDLGFMLYCSFGNGYRLTGNPAYLEVMRAGAQSLSTRFNDKIGAVKSWDSSAKWQFPVIIDNMMNLEFLAFMGKKTGERNYFNIANTHARTTLKNHFRADYSSYHVVSYDTISGQPHAKNTHQGYADNSAWARGQAWGLYGYTMMYRETKDKAYLEQAQRIASFIMNHPNMPSDKVPYWDFNAPDIPGAVRDASAAAVMASALIELSGFSKGPAKQQYLRYAEEQVRSLSSPQYLAEPGANGYFILKHSTGNRNKNSEVDAPLSYADYYYIEALTRLKKIHHAK